MPTPARIGPWAGSSCAGCAKVHTWALWIALAHNMLRTMEIVPHLMTYRAQQIFECVVEGLA